MIAEMIAERGEPRSMMLRTCSGPSLPGVAAQVVIQQPAGVSAIFNFSWVWGAFFTQPPVAPVFVEVDAVDDAGDLGVTDTGESVRAG